MADEPTTVLNFIGISIPPYSARGLTQTLTPFDVGDNLRRTINGELIDMTHEQFRKYKSTISGTDQQPPAIDGVWQGLTVIVDCICELAYLESGSPEAQRPEVSGSSRNESGFTFYRPQLTMLVTGFDISTDEYGALVDWTLELEEI